MYARFFDTAQNITGIIVSEKNLELLSDLITEAHTRIQKDFEHINPVVGVSRGMRTVGIPADAMSIDCLRTGKRIIIVLHDEKPETLDYQFGYRDTDPSMDFKVLNIDKLTAQILYDWMLDYFDS